LQTLGSLVETGYKGPRAGFGEAQVLKAILEIGSIGNVGRGRLAKLLDLGSGEARTLIRRLKASGLVRVDANGCSLARSGMKRFKAIRGAIPWSSEVPGSLLGIGERSYALILRKPRSKIRKGIEQRDAAIKAGAIGALSVVFKSGKFFVPYEGVNCERQGVSEPWTSIRAGHPKSGDIVIISGAESPLAAEYGALSAALTLM
jgi:hypothetical protein